MPPNCFVPNCTPKKNRLRNDTEHPDMTKVSLFRPRSVETLEKWQKAIGRSDREMTLNDTVCELHFDEDDIVRYFEHKLKDGTLYRLARGRPCLKPGSIPTIFSDYNTSSKPRYLKNKENEKNESDLCIGDSTIDCSIIDCSEQIMDDFDFNFKDIMDNINKIKLPCTSWTISNIIEIKNYIIATRWINLRPERWLLIDDDLNIKLIYRGREVDSIYQKISSIDDVNNLLKTVHRYDFCLGDNDNDMASCTNILEQSSQPRGRKKRYCNDCFIIRRRRADNLRRSSIKKRDPNSELHNKLRNLRRKNSRLLDKVMRLRRVLNGENYVKKIHQMMTLE